MAARKAKTEAVAADKYYRIVSKLGGKTLAAEDEEMLWMARGSRNEGQLFSFVPAEDGWYQIVHKKTGKVLDVMLAGVNDGAQLHLWDFVGADNQLWALEAAQGGYKIKSKASGKCMDIVGMSEEAGARVQIWEDVDGEGQTWILKEASAEPKAAGKEKKTAAKKAEAKPKTTRTRKAKSEE